VLYTEPWTGEFSLSWHDGPIYEYACHEGNYSMPGILRGGQLEVAQAAESGNPDNNYILCTRNRVFKAHHVPACSSTCRSSSEFKHLNRTHFMGMGQLAVINQFFKAVGTIAAIMFGMIERPIGSPYG